MSSSQSAPPLTLGWVFNLEDTPPSSNAARDVAILAATSALALFSVILRVVQRWKKIKSMGWDDFFACWSMIIGVGYNCNSIYQTRWGMGLPNASFPPENAAPYGKVQFAGGPMYYAAVLGFKMSLLAGYIRVAGFNKRYRLILYIAMALATVNQILWVILITLTCLPVRKQWVPDTPGTCMNQMGVYYTSAITSLLFDVVCIVLPFPILKQLQLDMRKKIGVGVMYALGFLVTAFTIVRIVQIGKLVTYTDSEELIMWSSAEIHVGVYIACLPAYMPLLRLLGRKVSKSSQSQDRLGGGKCARDGSKTTSFATKRSAGGKSNPLGTITRIEEGDDDEVALWDKQPSHPHTHHAWAESNAHPLADLNDKGVSSLADGDSYTNRTGAKSDGGSNDIRVTQETSVLRGPDK